MTSTANKNYLYFIYTKNGLQWDEDPIVDEIPAPQDQIKRKAETKNKNGTALLQLQRMGNNRRNQIDRHVQVLNSRELDGSIWEPVWIDSTVTRRDGNKVDVRVFEIIFARKQAQPKRHSMGPMQPLPHWSMLGEVKTGSTEGKAKRERRKSKEKKTEKAPKTNGALEDDPFGETQWFDMSGGVAGGQGGNSAGLPGLPPFIPPEKPIGTMKPRIIAGLDPDKDDIFNSMNIPGAFEPGPVGLGIPMGGNDTMHHQQHDGGPDDIIAIEDSHHDRRTSGRRGRHQRHPSNRARSGSGRRSQQRQRSNSRTRNVRFSNQFNHGPVFTPSSGSSVASGEPNYLFDEVEELSSRTSEDTSGSSKGQKVHRPVAPTYRQHVPGPSGSGSRHYELVNNETVVMPARSRRRSSRAAEEAQMQNPYGIEQPLRRVNTSPRQPATLNQRRPLIRTISEQPQVQRPYSVEEPPMSGMMGRQPAHYVEEHPLIGRNPAPRQKAAVHQQNPPSYPPADVPPIAVYPQHFEGHERRYSREEEELAEDYMRDSIRERTLRQQEAELNEKARALDRERQALDEEVRRRQDLDLRTQMENMRFRDGLPQRRSTTYTHEPRDFYRART